ncbi:MAG: acyl carrier protein [Clostridia bacterium]|nr:acyl carrier protein [Clostridia bacterium]
MNNEIFEKIKKTVAEQLDIDEDSILETSNFTTDLHADSLALLEILIALEEEFGIDLDEEESENIKTVKDAIEYIENAIEG